MIIQSNPVDIKFSDYYNMNIYVKMVKEIKITYSDISSVNILDLLPHPKILDHISLKDLYEEFSENSALITSRMYSCKQKLILKFAICLWQKHNLELLCKVKLPILVLLYMILFKIILWTFQCSTLIYVSQAKIVVFFYH